MSRIARMVPRAAVLAAGVACLSPVSALAAPYGHRTLERSDRGRDVRTMQRYLTRVRRTTPATGYFGSMTEASLRHWQRSAHRRVDGRLTPRDARVLKRAALAASSATGVARTAPTTTSPPAGTGGAGPTTLAPATGRARLLADGTAIAPADAPPAVQAVIAAGNVIAKKPYTYGGGHNLAFRGTPGYDCSGSVSYALHGGDLLDSPVPSSGFYGYGKAGKGSWITIYANGGHAYMVVAGLRFDTSGADPSRWQTALRSNAGFQVRHPTGY